MEAVNVTGDFNTGFNITLTPRNCAYDFPLIAVEGYQVGGLIYYLQTTNLAFIYTSHVLEQDRQCS